MKTELDPDGTPYIHDPTHSGKPVSPEAERTINETIARWLGWTRLHIAQLNRDHPNDRDDWLHGNPPGSEGGDAESEVPNFTGSLDACALAEIRLITGGFKPGDLWLAYVKELHRFTNGKGEGATAMQRSLALVKVLKYSAK